MAFIPRVGAPFLDHRGEVSKEWRDYLQQIPADQAIAAIRAEIQALANRVNDIDQNAPETHNLLGQGSVRVFGDLTESNATVQLDGDEVAPAASRYYGTDSTGARGYHALPEPPPVTAVFNYISADGEPYVTEDGDLYIGA